MVFLLPWNEAPRKNANPILCFRTQKSYKQVTNIEKKKLRKHLVGRGKPHIFIELMDGSYESKLEPSCPVAAPTEFHVRIGCRLLEIVGQ